MKGQFLISEVIIFALGLAITAYIVFNFNAMQARLRQQAVSSQLAYVANSIASATAIAAADGATKESIAVHVPPRVFDETYTIRFQRPDGGTCSKGDECSVIVSTSSIRAEKKIFNIGSSYNLKGGIHSAAAIVLVKSGGDTIELMRG